MIRKFILLAFIIYMVESKKTSTTTTTTTVKATSKKSIYEAVCNKTHGFTIRKVIDGDTANVKNYSSEHGNATIRFKCIDAPEKSQPKWGAESLRKLDSLLPLKTPVTLISCMKDPYGRIVAEVLNNKGVNINKKMVELGYAVVYPFQSGCDDYKKIEKEAKEKKRGVFGDPEFVLPWKYREQKGIGLRGKTSNESTSTKKSSKSPK